MSTTTDRPEPRPTLTHVSRLLGLIVFWTLLTMSAGAVARPTMLLLRAPWGGLLAGALTGLLQWTALGGDLLGYDPPGYALADSGWWIVATSIALGVTSLFPGRLAAAPAAILSGAVLGAAQWLVLRRSIRWSAHWILVSAAVAWPAASLAMIAVAWLTPRNSPLVAQVLAGALQGTLVGAAAGVLLATLLPGAGRKPQEPILSELA